MASMLARIAIIIARRAIRMAPNCSYNSPEGRGANSHFSDRSQIKTAKSSTFPASAPIPLAPKSLKNKS